MVAQPKEQSRYTFLRIGRYATQRHFTAHLRSAKQTPGIGVEGRPIVHRTPIVPHDEVTSLPRVLVLILGLAHVVTQLLEELDSVFLRQRVANNVGGESRGYVERLEPGDRMNAHHWMNDRLLGLDVHL